MNDTPLPDHAAKQVLYVLDASHRLEQRLLEQWLLSGEQEDASRDCARVVLPIATSRDHIPAGELERHLDKPADTLLVPLRIAWLSSLELKGSRPRLRDLLWGHSGRPGVWRARYILKYRPDRVRRLAAEPATLGELRERMRSRGGDADDSARLADFIASQAGLALDIAERRLRGSRYKVPRQVARQLQSSSRLKLDLQLLAADSGRPLEDLEAESERIMKELVSTPSPFWIDVMGALTRKVRTLGYQSDMVIDPERLQRARQISREYPCVFLFTHKSHVDGFAHLSVLYENDFPAPHTLGGINMAFAGIGYTFRHSGAIFIRRSFSDDELYKLVLRRYIGYLMDKRFSLSWAFEGTRSRVGKLMPPRYGLLKYVIEAAHASGIANLHIIPVAINYDLIGDVQDYATEQSGISKRPESLGWFMGYLKGLMQPLGQIYLDYGEPVVLESSPSPDDRLALSKLAFQVGVEANKVAPVTLPSLIAMILLGAAPGALTRSELLQRLDEFVGWIRERGIRLTNHFEPRNRQQLIDLFRVMVRNGLITEYGDGPEELFAIKPEQHSVASYYRNTTAHYFVTKAIAELALLHVSMLDGNRVEAFWAHAERLRDSFKFEFFYAPTEEFRQELRQELERYRPGWEASLETEPAFAAQLLSTVTPHVAHATLLPYVEAYRVVSDILAGMDDEGTLEAADCVSRALGYGRQAYLQRRISSEASVGKLLFENGYRLMSNMGLTEGGTENIGARRREQSRGFRELAFRLERIRILAQPS
jgi:glycerol-3-phosphate O-acyltransferase